MLEDKKSLVGRSSRALDASQSEDGAGQRTSDFTLGHIASLAQDLAAGANSYKKCAPCHDVGANAKNKVGPMLNGLDGRKSGTVAGYSYSDANKNAGIVWNEESFLEYIKDPRAKVPNTKMAFVGIKDAAEAKNLWAYIKQFDAMASRRPLGLKVRCG